MRSLRLYIIVSMLLSLASCVWAQSPVMIQTSDTTHPLTFTLIRASYPASASTPGIADHINGLTGALTGGAITAQISKNGGSYTSTAGTFAELANGRYSYTPTSGEVGTGGALDIYCQATLNNATTAPTTATATSGGTIAANTYFCAYTWTTGTGETAVSSTATQVTTGTTSTITITAPTLPSNASGINAYVGTASNNMTRAGSSFTNSVTFTALPVSQPAAPASNTATTSDPKDFGTTVVAFSPYNSTNLGLSAIPAANAGSPNGLITYGTSNGQLNATAGNLPGVTTALTGTATAGGATTITLAAGPATTDTLKGDFIALTGGTGVGQSRVITGWNGGTLVATVSRSWATNPDATSTYAVIMNPHPAMDSNLAVTAGTVSDKTGYSLTQTFPTNFSSLSVDVSGKVALQSGEHTSIQTDAATGILVTPSQKIATNASNQVVASSVQGNVTGSVGSVTGNVGGITGITFPSNFGTFSIDGSGKVTLTSAEHTAISGTDVPAAFNTAQPGSPTAGSPFAHLANLDAAISSRLAASGYTAPPTLSQIFGHTSDGLSLDDILTILLAQAEGVSTNSWNSGTLTLSTVYKRQDGTTTAFTNSTIYKPGSTQPPVISRSGTNGTLP